MVRFACCLPGGAFIPDGAAEAPQSRAQLIIEKCRYLLNIGYDCTECAAGMLLDLSEDELAYLAEENKKSPLKLSAVNCLFPGNWKLADPDQDKTEYIERAAKVFDLMQTLEIPYAVFGSGGARSILMDKPEESRASLIAFMKAVGAEAGKRGVKLLIEPLRKKESNVFNTVEESGETVKEIADDNILLLYDSYHMAEEGTDLGCVKKYAPVLRHCHIAEYPNRTYPGCEDGTNPEYNQIFARELNEAGYEGVVSVECGKLNFKQDIGKALQYMRRIFNVHTTFEYRAIRTIEEEPVFLQPKEGKVTAAVTAVMCGNRRCPASPYKNGVIAILTAEKGEELTLTACEEEAENGAQIRLCAEESKVDVSIQGHHFANYQYTTDIPKPFFGPVVDNGGSTFTRPDINHHEHKHQRSVFIAVGDVNGVDCWNEYNNFGYVRNEEISDVYSGSAYASFKVKNLWSDKESKPLLTETTRYTVYNQDEACRTLDIEVTFTADYGEVKFGATKEAGPLGIRLRDELRADIGTGQLSNSWGAVGEDEAWGKAAQWCDYTGEIEGIGTMGVTVFDDERNERHPTAWHIRGYGLFAANNLYFKGGLTIKAGESLTYRYRILFRRKPLSKDAIADKYVVYTLGKK